MRDFIVADKASCICYLLISLLVNPLC